MAMTEVVEVQPTPNPNALKFVLNRPIVDRPTSFLATLLAWIVLNTVVLRRPIASRLFEVPGVASVLLLGDFVTVNKDPAIRWERITGRVREILKEC